MKIHLFIRRSILLAISATIPVSPAGYPTGTTIRKAQARSHGDRQIYLPMVAKPYSFHRSPKPLDMPVLLDISRASEQMVLALPESGAPVGTEVLEVD